MNDRNERSSDIDAAREISRRLSGHGHASGSPGVAQPRYVVFRRAQGAPLETGGEQAKPVVRSEVSGPPASPPASVPLRIEQLAPPAVENWDDFLLWCTQRTGCSSALLVDGQGFVVARFGQGSLEESEGLAAELSLAMEHLAQIDVIPGGLRSATLEYGSLHVAAVRAAVRDEVFLLGLVSAVPITLADKQSVQGAFADALTKLG
jgi:hypothetical protein